MRASPIALGFRPCGFAPQHRPVRVVAVIPGDGQGSSFIFARRQVQSLQEAGSIEIKTFLFDTGKSLSIYLRNCHLLRRAIRSSNPDIVHAHYGTMTALACALVSSKPLLITFQGSDLNPEPGYSWLRTRSGLICSHLAAIRARQVICVSRQLAATLWWCRRGITIIPSGINLQEFVAIDRVDARRRLGWDLHEPVVLFNAGRAPIVKGLALAENVIERVRLRRQIRFEVMRGDVSPEKVPVLMSAADCLLVTSLSEGSPTVVREALACSLPVISVDVGDVRERLRGVHPSWVVSRNPEEISAVVLAILEQPVRSNGRAAAEATSHSNIARQILQLYYSMLNLQAEETLTVVEASRVEVAER